MNNQIVNFLNNNKSKLIQVYINERIRNDNIEGLLLLTKTNNNINVAFMGINVMPSDLLNIYNDHTAKNNNRKDIIYFYVCEDENNAYFIDINL